MRPTLACAALALLVTAGALAQPRLLAVPRVDLERYAGTWHEVARLPNRFQDDCVSEVTATYAPRPDGTLSVVNRCRTAQPGDGAVVEAEGEAWPVDESNAKLKVSFLPGWLRWLPVGRGDYWVVELDADYRWALVGEPSRRTMWVLSRTPSLPAETLEGILGRAKEMGFETGRAIVSPAQAGPPPPAASR